MFQFHGWATVHYHTHDTDSAQQDHCWRQLVEHVATIPNELLIQLQRYNGCDSVHVAGQHNHRAEYIIALFRWIADTAPGAYGLLYVRDDEDQSRDNDYTNRFRVWRLCRGQLTECDDSFLSPAIPIVEDPYDESRND